METTKLELVAREVFLAYAVSMGYLTLLLAVTV